jgi:hypothetical protein
VSTAAIFGLEEIEALRTEYGDLHRGACVVFHRERLQTVLREAWASCGTGYYLDEVRYTPAGIAESASRTLIDDRIFKAGPTTAIALWPHTSRRTTRTHSSVLVQGQAVWADGADDLAILEIEFRVLCCR